MAGADIGEGGDEVEVDVGLWPGGKIKIKIRIEMRIRNSGSRCLSG